MNKEDKDTPNSDAEEEEEKLKEVNFLPCIQCGACSASCPYGFDSIFNPRKMIAAIKSGIVKEIIESQSHWLCSSCYLCSYRCPSKIQITDFLIPYLREISLFEDKLPEELKNSLISLSRYGNPFKESPRKRDSWAKDLKNLEPEFDITPISSKTETEYLFITGCFGAYHRRCKEITKAFAKIMKIVEVDFAILGKEEKCIGELARLNGEFGLFEHLAQKNINILNKYKFKYIVTHDAHVYNALLNEYPKFGFKCNILHHTQFMFNKLRELRDLFNKLDCKVTYHDPCYIGRKNGIYDEPREVIKSIPGVNFVEMKRIKENSLCCGGGSAIWLDSIIRDNVKERPAELRVKEAIATGADLLVTSCTLDVPMFEDALKVTGLEGEIEVLDIAELVLRAIY